MAKPMLRIPIDVRQAMADCESRSPAWCYQYGNWICAVNGFVERVAGNMENRDAVFMKLYELAIAASAEGDGTAWTLPTPG